MSATTREYRIRLSAQGKRQLVQYFNSIGKDGEKELHRIEAAARKASGGMGRFEKSSRRAGTGLAFMTSQSPGIERLARVLGATAITTGVVRIGTSALDAAKLFQAAMQRIQGVMGATDAQMEQLEAKARKAGATTAFRATEAADAIEMLAKNGIRYQDIVDGALDATLGLAGALGGDLSSAADLTTDLMVQFGLKASDLSRIVDLVAGAAINSKFGFDDLKRAIGQAGGVAGQFGVDIDEFLTALAATAAGFSSGQDAGTSFKTFLMRLSPQSKEAATIMKNLGLEFFDASGNMKSLVDIAEELRQGVKGLTEEARNDSLRQIFGTDAIRTALLLAAQGAEGMNALAKSIANVSAQDQAEIRLKGLEGALRELASAWESLQLTSADQGGLEFAEDAVRRFTEAIRYLNENFDEVNEVVERVANALAVILVARGMNVAIARAAALAAAYVEVASSLGYVNSAGAITATRLQRVGIALRGVTAALGGPLGLVAIASVLGALFIDLDRTEDNLNDAATAADNAAKVLDRFREATKNAATEQSNLGTETSEATRQMLAQSRAEMQKQLKELFEVRNSIQEDLDGKGLINRNDFSRAKQRIQGSYRGNNGPLDTLANLIEQVSSGKGDVKDLLDELERLGGIGEEAHKFADAYDEAFANGSDELAQTVAQMQSFAELVGGFEKQLSAVRAAADPTAERIAWDNLRDALNEAGQAGEVVRHRQVESLTELLQAAVSTELKITALQAALNGNWDLVRELEGSNADPFKPIKESAGEAADQVDRLSLSIAEQKKLYGEGIAAFDKGATTNFNEGAKGAAEKGLLALVRYVEGTSGSQGYNTTLDYGRWTDGPQNLTGKTLNEIIALQGKMLANPENRALYGNGRGSSAVGAYQITRQTLMDYLMPTLGLTGDEIFDESLQDRMAQQLVRRRNGQGFDGLRNEWQGLHRVNDRILSTGLINSPIQTVDPTNKENEAAANEQRLKEQERERELLDALVSSGKERASQLEFESTLVGRSAEEQTRLRFVYEKLAEAKRQGLDVDAQIPGSSETVRQAIERQAAAVAALAEEERKRVVSSDQFKSDVSEAYNAIAAAADKVRKSPENIGEAFADVTQYISDKLWALALDPVFNKIAENIAGAFSGAGGAGGDVVVGFFSSLLGLRDGGDLAAIPALAGGGQLSPTRASGRIEGFGSKTEDNVLLWGSRDEFMMNARAVDYYGADVMNMLNKMQLPRRADGGGFKSFTPSNHSTGTGVPLIGNLNVYPEVSGEGDAEQQGEELAASLIRALPAKITEQIGFQCRDDGLIGRRFKRK